MFKYDLIKQLIAFILIAGCTPLMAQNETETLFGEDIRIGGFGGPILEWGPIADDITTITGGGGGVLLNDFFLGGYGMSSSTIHFKDLSMDREVEFDHGGFWIGYSFPAYKVVHGYTEMKIGWGSYESEDDDLGSEDVFLLQPGLGVEINVFSWFRIVAAGNYRYVEGSTSDVYDLTNEQFRNISFNLTLRFGYFAD